MERGIRSARRIVAGLGTVLLVAGLSVVVASPQAQAVDNGLAKTPPMGFNDWNSFGCNVDEQLIKQTADYFVSSGLKDAGYNYVNIDDCWLTHSRDADGKLVPDPVKFPDGIKGTADYVHSLGLKLGIYEDAGTATCAGYPGSLGHETTDAQTFADWGVDYLKYDNCNNAGSTTTQQYIDRYTAMGNALKATGRPIVYSICEWGVNDPANWAGDVGNLWRTTGDIGDNWNSLKSIIAQNAPLAPAAHPGAWNDPDMLEVGNGGMTDTEYKTHFGLWAEMAAPLLIGTDLRTATPETLNILKNKDVIAVDQDPLGKQGQVVASSNGTMVFDKPLANGDHAVALYNSTDAAATVGTTAAALKLPKSAGYLLHDLWAGTTTETAGAIRASVPAHGTVLYRVSASRDWDNYAPASSLGIASSTAFGAGDVATQAGQSASFTDTRDRLRQGSAGGRARQRFGPQRLDDQCDEPDQHRFHPDRQVVHHRLVAAGPGGHDARQLSGDDQRRIHLRRRDSPGQHAGEGRRARSRAAADRNHRAQRRHLGVRDERLGAAGEGHEQRRDGCGRRASDHDPRAGLPEGARRPRDQRDHLLPRRELLVAHVRRRHRRRDGRQRRGDLPDLRR